MWNASWTGGISNPLEVIEQITYLLFLKRLDDNQIAAERKASRTGKHTVGRTEDRPKGPPDPAAWKLPSTQRQPRMRGIWRFAEPRTPAPKECDRTSGTPAAAGGRRGESKPGLHETTLTLVQEKLTSVGHAQFHIGPLQVALNGARRNE